MGSRSVGARHARTERPVWARPRSVGLAFLATVAAVSVPALTSTVVTGGAAAADPYAHRSAADTPMGRAVPPEPMLPPGLDLFGPTVGDSADMLWPPQGLRRQLSAPVTQAPTPVARPTPAEAPSPAPPPEKPSARPEPGPRNDEHVSSASATARTTWPLPSQVEPRQPAPEVAEPEPDLQVRPDPAPEPDQERPDPAPEPAEPAAEVAPEPEPEVLPDTAPEPGPPAQPQTPDA
ncbi:MAG: hypothetical protein FWF02_07260 [Micrococcales bacterium]|nr:hypothetical protein [Micrococcales bacterium]MCL2667490.1 hypothetical protein [Micrococcales bacterium]